MLPIVEKVAKEYKRRLYQVYHSELAEVILFGSHARGDYHDESDLDFAVVLKNPATRPSEEIPKIAVIAFKLELKYGLMLSSLPVSLLKKQTSMQGVYQDIRKEGIAI